MKLFEIIAVAVNSLRINKLRSTLTILGIVVGIFSIISISTVIAMLQTSIEDGVSALGKNTFQIQKWPSINTGSAEERALIRNRRNISVEEYYRLQHKLKDDALLVGGELWRWGRTLKFGNEQTNPNVNLSGCTPEAFPNNNWVVEFGREFNQNEVESAAKLIILGKDIADKLFDYLDPIGQEIWMDGRKYKVLGVLESQGAVFGQSQDNFAVIPINTFLAYYGSDRNNSVNITIQSYDKAGYDKLIEITEGYFRTIRKVPPGEPNDFEIRSNEQMLKQINEMTAGVRIGAFSIAAIALLAAGIGIMNIMLVSVTERTKEIGIRKSIGAKRSNILVQFLVESITLSILGGIVGIVFGVSIGNWVGSLMNATAVIPMDWVGVGVSLCVIIGVIFGTYPAYKAANLDPIEALRYE
ncbi:MAG: peptide ABC transporter permease [Ignavibacteriae bacterium HGW-Ignavibacteriae-2]|jgi:putative ABC transport system permease protein|nr:MAG: peptide ABC transporter permease [Ignavibacteriae bacterium HGW-Ignavibacteriae-2]